VISEDEQFTMLVRGINVLKNIQTEIPTSVLMLQLWPTQLENLFPDDTKAIIQAHQLI